MRSKCNQVAKWRPTFYYGPNRVLAWKNVTKELNRTMTPSVTTKQVQAKWRKMTAPKLSRPVLASSHPAIVINTNGTGKEPTDDQSLSVDDEGEEEEHSIPPPLEGLTQQEPELEHDSASAHSKEREYIPVSPQKPKSDPISLVTLPSSAPSESPSAMPSTLSQTAPSSIQQSLPTPLPTPRRTLVVTDSNNSPVLKRLKRARDTNVTTAPEQGSCKKSQTQDKSNTNSSSDSSSSSRSNNNSNSGCSSNDDELDRDAVAAETEQTESQAAEKSRLILEIELEKLKLRRAKTEYATMLIKHKIDLQCAMLKSAEQSNDKLTDYEKFETALNKRWATTQVVIADTVENLAG